MLALVPWSGRADLPLLALNELRLVLRIAQAYGAADDPPGRLPELAATVGVGLGLRALARAVPGAGRPINVAVAYAGTRALGEVARVRDGLALGGGRPEPRTPRADRAQTLRQPGPRPGLDLVVAGFGLAPGHLEVFEPCVGLFDHQELFCLAFRRHGSPPAREMAGS